MKNIIFCEYATRKSCWNNILFTLHIWHLTFCIQPYDRRVLRSKCGTTRHTAKLFWRKCRGFCKTTLVVFPFRLSEPCCSLSRRLYLREMSQSPSGAKDCSVCLMLARVVPFWLCKQMLLAMLMAEVHSVALLKSAPRPLRAVPPAASPASVFQEWNPGRASSRSLSTSDWKHRPSLIDTPRSYVDSLLVTTSNHNCHLFDLNYNTYICVGKDPHLTNEPEYCGRTEKQLPLEWHHLSGMAFSNHRRLDCLLNRLFRRGSKKTSKIRITCLCEGNSPVTGDRWIPRTNGL